MESAIDDLAPGLKAMQAAASAVETVAAGGLLDLPGLPAQASGGFVTGATVANFLCAWRTVRARA